MFRSSDLLSATIIGQVKSVGLILLHYLVILYQQNQGALCWAHH